MLGQDSDQVTGLAYRVIGQRRDTDTGLHGPIYAVDIIDLEQIGRVDPRHGHGVQQPVDMGGRRPKILAIDHKVVLIKVLDALRHGVRLEVFGRRVDVGVQGHQPALHQIRLAWGVQADGDIGLPHAEVDFLIGQEQRQGDFRIEVDKFLDPGGEPDGAQGDRGRDL